MPPPVVDGVLRLRGVELAPLFDGIDCNRRRALTLRRVLLMVRCRG